MFRIFFKFFNFFFILHTFGRFLQMAALNKHIGCRNKDYSNGTVLHQTWRSHELYEICKWFDLVPGKEAIFSELNESFSIPKQLLSNSLSHSFTVLTRDISSWTLEEKLHISAHPCVILFLITTEKLLTLKTWELLCFFLLERLLTRLLSQYLVREHWPRLKNNREKHIVCD